MKVTSEPSKLVEKEVSGGRVYVGSEFEGETVRVIVERLDAPANTDEKTQEGDAEA